MGDNHDGTTRHYVVPERGLNSHSDVKDSFPFTGRALRFFARQKGQCLKADKQHNTKQLITNNV